MATPPPKKPSDKPKSKPASPAAGPPPPAGPPMGPPPGPDPMAAGGMAPPMPGSGIDPYAAMMGGGGMTGPAGPPIGPPPMGFPMGGEPDMDDSINPILKALMQGGGGMMRGGPAMQAPGDPYGTMPGESQSVFDGVGTGDPNMGLQQLITLLMLAKAGVGGGPMSSAGLDPSPFNSPTGGMDFTPNQGPSFGGL